MALTGREWVSWKELASFCSSVVEVQNRQQLPRALWPDGFTAWVSNVRLSPKSCQQTLLDDLMKTWKCTEASVEQRYWLCCRLSVQFPCATTRGRQWMQKCVCSFITCCTVFNRLSLYQHYNAVDHIYLFDFDLSRIVNTEPLLVTEYFYIIVFLLSGKRSEYLFHFFCPAHKTFCDHSAPP